jgi:hypothetical protein
MGQLVNTSVSSAALTRKRQSFQLKLCKGRYLPETEALASDANIASTAAHLIAPAAHVLFIVMSAYVTVTARRGVIANLPRC